MTVMRIGACLALAFLAACGEDDPPPAHSSVAASAAAPAGAAPAGAPGSTLTPMVHVEDRVVCPVPEKPTDVLPPATDKCDPQSPEPCKCNEDPPTAECKEREAKRPYCLSVPIAGGSFCMACPERDSIRHAFKDRDYVNEQNRDPFQSFVLQPVGLGSNDKPTPDVTGPPKCNEYNSYAPSYSYMDLKLVGIVTQGTQRKGLMTGGRSSYIIKRNDCVGKEKALVKEVGEDYVTFLSQPEADATNPHPAEFSTPLHNTPLSLDLQPQPDGPRPTKPPTQAPAPSPTKPGQRQGEPKAPAPSPSPSPTQPPQTLKP